MMCDRLANILMNFIDNAKLTGQGLQRLSAQVNGAVDSIIAVNDYALRTIEATNNASPSSLLRFSPFRFSPRRSDAVLRETFADAMGVLSANMARLIIEARSHSNGSKTWGNNCPFSTRSTPTKRPASPPNKMNSSGNCGRFSAVTKGNYGTPTTISRC